MAITLSTTSFRKFDQVKLFEKKWDASQAQLCPQVGRAPPEYDERFPDLSYFKSNEFSNHSLEVWRNAVRISTTNGDDLGKVGEDPR